MSKEIISEKFLCEIWEKSDSLKNLKTTIGEPIEIISKGKKNTELDGPDYINSKVRIGKQLFAGDIEIDTNISNWQKHNHHTNKKYNNVILHIVYKNETNQNFVTSESKRIIPSVEIAEFISPSNKTELAVQSVSDKLDTQNKIPCAEVNQSLSDKYKKDFLISLGSKRFNIKRNKLFTRLKELSYLNKRGLKEPVVTYDLESELEKIKFLPVDFSEPILWEQLLYENIFTALGYSKNKDNMTKLAKSVEIKLLKNIKVEKNLIQILEAILFSVSGLLPEVNNLPDEETSVYTRNMFELWIKYSDYDYGARLHPAMWNFFRMRPQNFPTVRIAGGAKILKTILDESLIPTLISIIEKEKDQNKLKQKLRGQFIIKAEGYWQDHFVFDQPSKTRLRYLIGKSRSDEIVINIILPFLSLYFEIFKKKILLKNVLNIYLNYEQIGTNKLVNDIFRDLKINSKNSVIYQGAIHLYWNYCKTKKCDQCKIGKKVFV